MPLVRSELREDKWNVNGHSKLSDALADMSCPSMAEKALQGPPADTLHDGQYILMPPAYADINTLQAPPLPLPEVVEKKNPLLYSLCTPTVQLHIDSVGHNVGDQSKPLKRGKLEAAPEKEPGQYILMPPTYADKNALQAPPSPETPIRYASCVPTAQPAVTPYAYPYYPWNFPKRGTQERRQLNDLLRWCGPETEEVDGHVALPQDIERMNRTVEEASTLQAQPQTMLSASHAAQKWWIVRTIWT
jgi:hypothetical protein